MCADAIVFGKADTKDDSFETYMGRWTRVAVEGLVEGLKALGFENPEEGPGGEV